MSTGGEVLKTVLDIAKAGNNWANLDRRPSVCLIGKDRADQCSPGDTIFIKEEDGSFLSTVDNTPIFNKDYCSIRIVESNHDDRENAFSDIKIMFKNSSYSIIIDDYNRENIMNLFIMKLKVLIINF